MSRKAVSMRKAREILRLKYEMGLGVRLIARSLRISHGTVVNYLQRAETAGVTWPLPEELNEEQLQNLLFSSQRPPDEARRALPDMAEVHKELRGKRHCKGITLQLLWEEYRAEHADGYGYTQFCEYYNRFESGLEPVLRQTYVAGEKLFVDWAGETIPLAASHNIAMRQAYLFVAALGASNYTYVEAFENMRLACWIEAHIHAWEFFGGVTRITVPDNPKTAVIKACRYEPWLQRTYEELGECYGTVIIPARSREPQDKAKVEEAVQNSERRIVAVLRHLTFFNLTDLNVAIRKELVALNERPFQKMPGCRATLFVELDKPALLPLPAHRYEMGLWKEAKANIDYHVQVDWHFYSVPSRLANQLVEVRISLRIVEIFHRGQRVAVHQRNHQRGGFTTDPTHRPKSHQQHLEWTPSRLVSWSQKEVGKHCGEAVAKLLESKPHPEQGYRSCLGIMRLQRRYGVQRLESACQRAVALDACNYQSIKSILATAADRQPLPLNEKTAPNLKIVHQNLRGHEYYAPAESATGGEREV
jgi:transposase